MPKNILIFSDGTGQIGGLKPDQRLTNIYKMYRAMRSGPDSPISPSDQFAFYDPGLGAGEIGGITLKRIRNILAAAVGTGISENMVDCYEATVGNYEPGDKVFLLGFSRGAYTARCVANVMNLCGIPTRMPSGEPIPRHGPALRKIARDAVLFVYEHGSGKSRAEYEREREEKARRFRLRYGSEGKGADGESQGNVQPHFVGVFDTVAALGSRKVRTLALVVSAILLLLSVVSPLFGWSWIFTAVFWLATTIVLFWALQLVWKQFKYFEKEPGKGISSWHFAAWNLDHYDRFLDNKVRFARHALSIDEARRNFPRVGWGSAVDVQRNANLTPPWLSQVWFAGNHTDIGGSYIESESRLSDIALGWMVDELVQAEPTIRIDRSKLHMYPSATGMQHDEIAASHDRWPKWVPSLLRRKLTWPTQVRDIHPQADLHPTVLERFEASAVSHLGVTRAYRPESLRDHHATRKYYS